MSKDHVKHAVVVVKVGTFSSNITHSLSHVSSPLPLSHSMEKGLL